MRILYAPGRGKDLRILHAFRKELVSLGHSMDILPVPYDTGPLLAGAIISARYDWWIGLSLGASLLCYVFPFTDTSLRPVRITAINPFFDRCELARQKNFSMAGQWDFTLADSRINIPSFDVVLSLADQSIPMEHGMRLSASVTADANHLVTVRADHQVADTSAQRELARVLHTLTAGVTLSDGTDHCHLDRQI